MDVQSIARVCHEANRAYCQSIGDNSQPDWDSAPDWQKQSAENGVRFHLENPNAAPSHSHDEWLKEKQATPCRRAGQKLIFCVWKKHYKINTTSVQNSLQVFLIKKKTPNKAFKRTSSNLPLNSLLRHTRRGRMRHRRDVKLRRHVKNKDVQEYYKRIEKAKARKQKEANDDQTTKHSVS